MECIGGHLPESGRDGKGRIRIVKTQNSYTPIMRIAVLTVVKRIFAIHPCSSADRDLLDSVKMNFRHFFAQYLEMIGKSG
ncbi:MAG: hypothetical protein ACLTSZ_15540 [Lachnospiraceae bacterium]